MLRFACPTLAQFAKGARNRPQWDRELQADRARWRARAKCPIAIHSRRLKYARAAERERNLVLRETNIQGRGKLPAWKLSSAPWPSSRFTQVDTIPYGFEEAHPLLNQCCVLRTQDAMKGGAE